MRFTNLTARMVTEPVAAERGRSTAMSLRRCACNALAFWICLAATGCGNGGLRDATLESPAGTPEAAAKATVREFFASLRAGKKDAVLQTIDVPFFNHHRFEIIDDRTELELRYDELFGPWIQPGGLPDSITALRKYGEVRGALRKVVRMMFDEVLTEDDFIATLSDGANETRYIFVRIRGDSVNVVGVTTP